jgi:hypothetical protein
MYLLKSACLVKLIGIFHLGAICVGACVRACVRACMHACVRVCVCVGGGWVQGGQGGSQLDVGAAVSMCKCVVGRTSADTHDLLFYLAKRAPPPPPPPPAAAAAAAAQASS